MSSKEITAVVIISAKAGKEKEIRELFARLTKETLANDEGCINYVFHQRVDNPLEFVCYERWKDQAALDAHWKRIFSVYGPPAPNIPIPTKILELFEKVEDMSLHVIE